MNPLTAAAQQLGLSRDDLIPYGHDLAKVPLELLDRPKTGQGQLVLVSAITPTPAGEGKTTTTIGLTDALNALGHNACAALREPSLGPCFGVKGGGTGGGESTLEPKVAINLHCTGDIHAVSAANNLLSALIAKHLHFNQDPQIDPRRITWRRVLDVNDRSLRTIVTGLSGQGLARETGFDISAASEIMAVLALSESQDDLRVRLGRIVVGFDRDKQPVTAEQLGATGALVALLKDALQPNLVRTRGGSPVFLHAGPFANIAHGCNSVLATRMAMHHADWVCTEAGFGFDLGAEKFFHIKCREAGLSPVGLVLVATVRALKYHGGVQVKQLNTPDVDALKRGFCNLERHLDSARALGFTPVVAINRFPADTDEELAAVVEGCAALGIRAVPATHFAEGGPGALELAKALVAQVEAGAGSLTPLTNPDMDVVEQLNAVAKGIYGADSVQLERKAQLQLGRLRRLGLDKLPVCISKTQSSLSDDPKRRGRPTGFKITVRELELSAGAGFVVALTGELVRMPGLGRRPQSENVDVVDGAIVGIGG